MTTESDDPTGQPALSQDDDEDLPQAPWVETDDDTDGPSQTYSDAPESLISLWMNRRKRLIFARDEALPPLDVDLAPLLATPIPECEPLTGTEVSSHAKKLHEIRTELVGRPELAALNGVLIAHLRKRRYPDHAPALFRRIWTETGSALMHALPGRWLISSVITFGDHGETEAQRRIGLSMNVFMSLMKLYEYERMSAGLEPGRPLPPRPVGGKRLPLGMPNFALLGVGLDINLLAQLWQEAESEPVAGALACHLLQKLNEDPGNLFRRIGIMRAAREMQKIDASLDASLKDRAPPTV